MVADIVGLEALNLTGIAFSDALLNKASNLIILFQAIGGLIIAYIVFNVINLFWNRKKTKEMEKMRHLLEQINRKLDKKKR